MKPRYTLRMFLDDMGSFTQPGCTTLEDALWHVNSARDHDGLAHIGLDKLKHLLRGSNDGWATFKEQP